MDDSFEPERKFKEPYSLLKVPRYSMKLIRGYVLSNLGVCLANAFLLDLKDMGFLNSFKRHYSRQIYNREEKGESKTNYPSEVCPEL